MFGTDVTAAAKAHALEAWPKESCGVVSGGAYVRIENVAADPSNAFEMQADTWTKYAPEAVIHGHDGSTVVVSGIHQPRHAHCPTAADMTSQIAAGIPFGIVSSDGETASDILWWGDQTLDEPLIGRAFVPGIYDCYALVRAWFHQEKGVLLPDFARDDGWWNAGDNLLLDHFKDAGFSEIEAADVQPGDGYLMRLFSPVPCHSGVVLDGGLCLHHIEGRLSRREPLGPWRKRVTHWVRHAA